MFFALQNFNIFLLKESTLLVSFLGLKPRTLYDKFHCLSFLKTKMSKYRLYSHTKNRLTVHFGVQNFFLEIVVRTTFSRQSIKPTYYLVGRLVPNHYLEGRKISYWC